jgi:hypothetical protein
MGRIVEPYLQLARDVDPEVARLNTQRNWPAVFLVKADFPRISGVFGLPAGSIRFFGRSSVKLSCPRLLEAERTGNSRSEHGSRE